MMTPVFQQRGFLIHHILSLIQTAPHYLTEQFVIPAEFQDLIVAREVKEMCEDHENPTLYPGE